MLYPCKSLSPKPDYDVGVPYSFAPVLLDVIDAVPPILLTILVIVVIIFIIKSLIKFAIIVGAIALVIFVAWRMGWIPGIG